MGRYIVLKVDSTAKAEVLLERLKPAPSVEVIGVFAFGTKHCMRQGECADAPERNLRRSSKWGTTHCSVCKLPVGTVMQHPRNLLIDPVIHPRYIDLHLSVLEPYQEPLARYGEQIIEQGKAGLAKGAEIMRKHRLKTARGRRRRVRGG